MMKTPIIILLILIFLFILAGCSSQRSNPIIPVEPAENLSIPISQVDESATNRVLWGMWDITINPSTMVPNCTREHAVPDPDREGAGHMNITTLLPTPTIVVKTWDPSTNIIGLDITIANPFTISGYDVRLIVYTDSLGHKLTNADDWTSLWDISGGLPINPFKSYAKDQPNRKFGGQSQYTENFKIYLPGGNWQFKIAVDASYPSNCVEPYELANFTQGIILDQAGSSTELEVTAHSWGNDVNSVKMYCPSITGTSLVAFHQIDSEKWGYTLVNNTTAQSGNYTGYLLATTSKSGSLALYDEVTIKITPLNSGWARTWGGVGDDYGQDIAVDNEGNVYSTGFFASTVDFNADPILEDIHTAKGKGDAFLVKYDKYGNFLWVKTWGGIYTDNDCGNSLDIDNSGNIFVAGVFFTTVDFGTGGMPDIHTANGYDDIFLTKYGSNGEYYGTVTFGGTGIDCITRLQCDSNGNSVLTGYFEGTVDFDPDPGSTDNHTSKGGYDVFTSKFNPSIDFLWARTWGGSNIWGDNGSGVAIDSYGNVYTSGYYGGTVDFNPGTGTDNHTSLGLQDVFLSKLDSNGNFLWAKTWGGGDSDVANECAVDENDAVYVVGDYKYTVDFNPDPAETEERTAILKSDVFVSKFATDGDFMWVLTWGGNDYDEGWAISTNKNGNIWVASYIRSDNVDFDPGQGIDIKDGGNCLSKFDLDGNYLWARIWDGAKIHSSFANYQEQIYLSGWFNNESLDFDPGSNKWKTPFFGGNFDCFIIKVLPNGYWE